MLENQMMRETPTLRAASSRNEKPAGAILLEEGQRLEAPLQLVEGWAALAQHSEEGELEIISLYLPGDMIGLDPEAAFCAVVALTPVVVTRLPNGAGSETVLHAILARQHEQLMRQALRTAHKSAKGRTGDLFLEIYRRLENAGLTDGSCFRLPLTQNVLASVLGMSTVHMNRVLMQLQHEGLIARRGDHISLPDVEKLSRSVNFRPLRALHSSQLPVS